MIAQWITGESRPVVRHRNGVVWCPFCDRSMQDTSTRLICGGCNAAFKEDAPEVTEPPTPRRRRQTEQDPPTDVEPTDPEPE